MDPDRAHSLGIKAEEVRIETFGGKYAGQWIAYVPISRRDGGEDKGIVTQSRDVGYLCRWKAHLKRLNERD